MAKFGTGRLYATSLLYGVDPQYLLGAGNISGAAALGTPTVNPGPVSVSGIGNIFTAEAFGTLKVSQMPLSLVLILDSRRLWVSPARRHLRAAPQINRLQVTPYV